MKNISKTVPHDSDFFVANVQRCAVPLEGNGGVVAVLEVGGVQLLLVFNYFVFLLWKRNMVFGQS